MRRVFFFVCSLLCFGTINVSKAQSQLSEQDKVLIKSHVEDIVNDFNGRVSEIWRRPNSVESQNMEKFKAEKEVQINEALKLFIGEGKDFEEEVIGERWDFNENKFVQFVEKERHRAAIMETSSISSSRITKQTIESYLRKAAYGIGHRVEVSACDAYLLTDLKQLDGERKYQATVAFFQDFVSYDHEGRKVYSDRTTKTIRVYITSEKRFDEELLFVKLGDIRTVEQ